ncbi:MAG: M24 family metallopeptidase [Nocardioidaceae bacterium]
MDRRPAEEPPEFSDAEFDRRRAAIRSLMDEHGVEVLLAYGANRSGSAVTWLTGWPVTREAVLVLDRHGDLELLVGFFNHVPNAQRLARSQVRVDWCGSDTAETVVRLLSRHRRTPAVGTLGALPASLATALASVARLVPLNRPYTAVRQCKSDEELAHLRWAAALTDLSAYALVAAAVPGATELDLVAAVEGAYAGSGGTNHVHYVTSTPMYAPDRCAPAQWPTRRRLARGDVVIFELSTAWGQDYPGQVLRTVTVDAEPTSLYRDLHGVAEDALDRIASLLRPGVAPAELLAAADGIERSGFVGFDDLVHGLGGGYLPPVLSCRSPLPTGLDAEPLRAGMALVVQPNVCTQDLRAGVQTGEMFVVTDGAPEVLHRLPRGILAGG